MNTFKRLLALCLFMCMLLGPAHADYQDAYDEGQRLLSKGEYAFAAEIFESLNGYADAPLLFTYCRTLAAAEAGEYALAIASLESLGNYKDCALLRVYYAARQKESLGGTDNLLQAAALYASIPFFRDSLARSRAAQCAVFSRIVGTMARAAQLTPRGHFIHLVNTAKYVYPLPGGTALVDVGNDTGYLVDSDGHLSVPYAFRDTDMPIRYSDGENDPLLLRVYVNHKFGLIDSTGREILAPEWGYIDNQTGDGLIAVGVNRDLQGYADLQSGRIVIPLQYQRANLFSEGLAAVQMNKKWGYINTNGDLIIAPQFENARPFSEGLAAVKTGGKYGYIDRTGQTVIVPQFEYAASFENGLAAVKTGEKEWAFINRSGSFAFEERWHQNYAPSFNSSGLITIEKDGKRLTLNREGEIVVQSTRTYYDLCEGLMCFKENDLFGYADAFGNTVIAPQFAEAGNFSEGLAAVKKDGGYGFIDKTGAFIIAPQFDYADYFSEGLAAVEVNGNFGYIDKTGAFVIALQFYRAEPFEQGMAWVELHEQPGEAIIDKTGRVLVSDIEHWMYTYAEDRLWVNIEEQWHLIELSTGRIIL